MHLRRGVLNGATRFASTVNLASSVGGVVAGICLVVLTASVGFEVFMRYILNMPTIWVFEMGHYLLAVVMAWPLAYGLKKGAHITVEIVQERVSPNIMRRLEAVTSLFTVGVAVLLLWALFGLTMRSLERNVVSETLLRVPLGWVQMVASIGLLLFLCQAIVMWVQKVAGSGLWKS